MSVCSVAYRLDFGMPFCCEIGVNAAADDVTSLSAVGPESHGGIVFTTTQWSVVLDAQGESPEAQEALEKLCRVIPQQIGGNHVLICEVIKSTVCQFCADLRSFCIRLCPKTTCLACALPVFVAVFHRLQNRSFH
jgi:hypothetical protein